jgi:hypothetical protein
MPVDAIDAQVQGLISGAQVELQKKIGQEDEADHARKAAEKKIAIKKEELKSSNFQREIFNRQSDVDNKMRQILGGAAGHEAADALNGWQNNQQLQAKLTEAQKNLFREAMAKNPKAAAEGANALNRLTQQPGFEAAIKSPQQMGTLQQGLLEHPAAEQPMGQVLQNRFMQSPKADNQAKNQFLRFGLERAKKGELDAIRRAGDMLGTLAKHNVGKTAQRAAMSMAQRAASGNATSNLDAFVQHPGVARLPSFARTKATELLAKTDGRPEVKEGFEQLASHPKFHVQTAQNKGRFFSTIGTGRPSEYRAITDKALTALQSPGFPRRAGQVGRLLGKMSAAVGQGGAAGVDPEKLIRSAKASMLPTPPTLASAEGLSEKDATRVRSENRAKIIQFFTKLQRVYELGEKRLNAAKYLEDVNALQNLRDAGEVDVSMLPPEDRAFVAERKEAVAAKLDKVRTLQRRRSRELRTKRMPPARRRAMAAARRAQGRQPKYFNPNVGLGSGSAAFTRQVVNDNRPAPLPQSAVRAQAAQSSARAQMQTSAFSVGEEIAHALSQLGDGPLTPQRAGQVAGAIAQRVAEQVAAQVAEQLLAQRPVGIADPRVVEIPEGERDLIRKRERTQTGKVDGWGIPRSFERDLGGAQRSAVKPHASELEGERPPSHDELAAEIYKGRMLVRDPAAIRSLGDLLAVPWKQLTKPELALLKNMGWNQQSWDTKESPAAKWPISMATPFAALNPTQRESVRKLGFTAHDWDERVQAFTMGKNA